MSTRSLRTTFLVGTLLIVVPIVSVLDVVVYLRARAAAHRALNDALKVRVETLSGLVEVDHEFVEFEIHPGELPEYVAPASGFYFVINDAAGQAIARSPSLVEEALPPPSGGNDSILRYSRIDSGPFGAPCAIAELSFRARIDPEESDEDGLAGSVSGDEPERRESDRPEHRFIVQVALDRRESDSSLASMAMFLAIAGLLGVAGALGGAALLSHLLLSPIRQMTKAARRMAADEPERRLEPSTMVRELHSLAATLNAAFDGLRAALERQKRFTADASHELRTPVTVLLSNAELLLRRDRSTEDCRQGLERQVRVAKRMAKIVNDLMILARADAGRDGCLRRAVDLTEVASSVRDEWRALAAEKGIALALSGPGHIVVTGDVVRLHQLVTNLVSNAVKFTPVDGLVTIETSVEDGKAVIRISDSGPGISPEHHTQIFERFFRWDTRPAGPDDPSSGTGLGLSIVAEIAAEHGGSVGVDSRPGMGAVFTVRLPLAEAPVHRISGAAL